MTDLAAVRRHRQVDPQRCQQFPAPRAGRDHDAVRVQRARRARHRAVGPERDLAFDELRAAALGGRQQGPAQPVAVDAARARQVHRTQPGRQRREQFARLRGVEPPDFADFGVSAARAVSRSCASASSASSADTIIPPTTSNDDSSSSAVNSR